MYKLSWSIGLKLDLILSIAWHEKKPNDKARRYKTNQPFIRCFFCLFVLFLFYPTLLKTLKRTIRTRDKREYDVELFEKLYYSRSRYVVRLFRPSSHRLLELWREDAARGWF